LQEVIRKIQKVEGQKARAGLSKNMVTIAKVESQKVGQAKEKAMKVDQLQKK